MTPSLPPSPVRDFADREQIRCRLRHRLRGRPAPLWVFPDGLVLTAGNLWALSRQWVEFSRQIGLAAGDRVVIPADPGPGFLAAVVAGWREGWTMMLVAPGESGGGVAEEFRPRLTVGREDGTGGVRCSAAGLPEPAGDFRPAERCGLEDLEARFLVRTSGSSGAARWVVLSDSNVMSVIDSHLPMLGFNESTRLLSGLPWHHAFGLVLELLAAMFAGAAVIRWDGELAGVCKRFDPNWLMAVPATVRRLGGEPGGREFLRSLRGGVVGGAPVDDGLASLLRETRLRVGYGQSEASPGICLGEPGEWSTGWIGRPVGCETRIAEGGELSFRGANACRGIWGGGGLQRLEADGWQRTGDRVRPDGTGLVFTGRTSDVRKLDNGRWFDPAAAERDLRVALDWKGELRIVVDEGGREFGLWIEVTGEPGEIPDVEQCRRILGGLASRLVAVRSVSAAEWPRTSKGEIDRSALRRQFFGL